MAAGSVMRNTTNRLGRQAWGTIVLAIVYAQVICIWFIPGLIGALAKNASDSSDNTWVAWILAVLGLLAAPLGAALGSKRSNDGGSRP